MKVIVVGGGASGMIAAITSAKQGNETILVEKTASLGNKIKITGKGRCNVTFDGDIEDFKENIKHNNKFMYSSYMNFSNKDVVEYFNSQGVETKLERGGRIFPVSDKAQDIVDALVNDLKKHNVKIMLNTELKDLIIKDGICVGIVTQKEKILADKVIIATGGKSYPSTGSDGKALDILEKNGITMYMVIIWPLGQAVKTPPSQGGIMGSIPVGVTNLINSYLENHMKSNKISFNVYKNILIAIIVMLYFIMINTLYYKLEDIMLLNVLKILSIVILVFGIVLLEIAYRKEKGGIFAPFAAGPSRQVLHGRSALYRSFTAGIRGRPPRAAPLSRPRGAFPSRCVS